MSGGHQSVVSKDCLCCPIDEFSVDGEHENQPLFWCELMNQVSLNLLVLKTRKVEHLRLFFQTLGVELDQEQHGRGPVHFAGRAGEVIIEVYPLTDAGSVVDSTTRLGFLVDELTMVVSALEGIECTVVARPKRTEWGLRAVVKDPDGRSVELTQRPVTT